MKTFKLIDSKALRTWCGCEMYRKFFLKRVIFPYFRNWREPTEPYSDDIASAAILSTEFFWPLGYEWTTVTVFSETIFSFFHASTRNLLQITLTWTASRIWVNWEMKRNEAKPDTCFHFTAANRIFIYKCAYTDKVWSFSFFFFE